MSTDGHRDDCPRDGLVFPCSCPGPFPLKDDYMETGSPAPIVITVEEFDAFLYGRLIELVEPKLIRAMNDAAQLYAPLIWDNPWQLVVRFFRRWQGRRRLNRELADAYARMVRKNGPIRP